MIYDLFTKMRELKNIENEKEDIEIDNRIEAKIDELLKNSKNDETTNDLIAQIIKEGEDQKHENHNMLDIFEILQIDNYCCRNRLMNVREFNKFLHSSEY
jgi:DNA-directed RNA polymerase subunit N (RpoN/RPB10)